jgi:cell division protein FtsB
MKTVRIILITALVVTLAVLSVAAFGKRGVFSLIKLGARKERLVTEIDRLKSENERLKQELNRMERPDYQERLIRQRMGMARDGEVIYIFPPE